MSVLNNKDQNYTNIIELLCKYKGIEQRELIELVKDKEYKYLLFLLLKKYDCIDLKKISRDFSINSNRSLNCNLKMAEEKMLLNRKIREMYFEAEEILENIK